jgi:hypothetical protein
MPVWEGKIMPYNTRAFTPKAVQIKSPIDDITGSAKTVSTTDKKRQELANYLGRSGRGVNCRIDIQILTLEDIRRAAYELDRLAKSLQKIAEATDQNDVLSVLSARHEFTKTKVQVKSFQLESKEK